MSLDRDGRTPEQFLEDLFEFEYCDECGGDVEGHEAIWIVATHTWFARCLEEWESRGEDSPPDPAPLDLDAIQRDDWPKKTLDSHQAAGIQSLT